MTVTVLDGWQYLIEFFIKYPQIIPMSLMGIEVYGFLATRDLALTYLMVILTLLCFFFILQGWQNLDLFVNLLVDNFLTWIWVILNGFLITIYLMKISGD